MWINKCIRSDCSTAEGAAILKAREPSIARLMVMLLAAAGGLALHMAPCTGRAEVIMAFYRNPLLPIKCSSETRNGPENDWSYQSNKITISTSLSFLARMKFEFNTKISHILRTTHIQKAGNIRQIICWKWRTPIHLVSNEFSVYW